MSRLFDGVNDLITFGSETDIDALSALSVLCWIKPASAGEAASRIINKAGSSAGSSGWRFVVDTGMVLGWNVDYDVTDLDVPTSTALAADVWSWIAVTWDGGLLASGVHIYINDAEASYGTTTNATLNRVSDAGNDLLVGNSTNLTRTVDGRIAHVQLWNRVLSLVELAQAARYPGAVQQGLLRYAPLFGAVSPEPDYTNLGTTGTVSGATASTDDPPINGMFVVPTSNLYYAAKAAGAAESITVDKWYHQHPHADRTPKKMVAY